MLGQTTHYKKADDHSSFSQSWCTPRAMRAIFVGCAVLSVCGFAASLYLLGDLSPSSSSAAGSERLDDGSPTLVVSQTNVTNGEWVNVKWSNLDESWLSQGGGSYVCTQDSHCKEVPELNVFIGLFVESANVTTIGPPSSWIPCWHAPYLASAPIKWKPITTTSGQEWFSMEANRHNLQFYIFRNGTSYPIKITNSKVVYFRDIGEPHHVHIGRTKDPSQMRVMWQSAHLDADAVVQWGFESGKYTNTLRAVPTTYTKDDLCGPPANSYGFLDPGYFYNALFKSLSPGHVIYYVVGSKSHGFTREFHFRALTPPGKDQTLKITAFADLGETQIDGSQYHWMEPYAINTTNYMVTPWGKPPQMKVQPRGRPMAAIPGQSPNEEQDALDVVDLLLHLGDLSYATGFASKWDSFLSQIEPFAARVPYMTGHGNHERDYPGTGSYFAGSDSGGECGLPTEMRFIMPTSLSQQDNAWYSFDQGPVHFVMMNTEKTMKKGSAQYSFLDDDLKNVNRDVTPWVIIMGHRPMYHQDTIEPDFTDAEELWYKYKVDLSLSGHVHLAQVTCPLYKGKCVTADVAGAYDAPIYAIIGNAGQSLSDLPPQTPDWTTYQHSEFGYSSIEVTGSQQLVMKLYADFGNVLRYTLTISRSQ